MEYAAFECKEKSTLLNTIESVSTVLRKVSFDFFYSLFSSVCWVVQQLGELSAMSNQNAVYLRLSSMDQSFSRQQDEMKSIEHHEVFNKKAR